MQADRELFVRYLLLLLNFVALICTIGSIGIGMRALDYADLEYLLAATNLFTAGASLLILVGALAFVLVAIGCFAAITQCKCLVMIYTVCLLAVMLMSTLAGTIGLLVRGQIESSIIDRMQSTLRDAYGHEQQTKMTHAWDFLQSKFSCCAISDRNTTLNYEMWSQSEWFRRQIVYPKQRVPATCCATCVTIHDRYCADDRPTNDTHHHAVCLAISRMCPMTGGSEYVNMDMCQGTIIDLDDDLRPPIESYMNVNGCDVPFERQMRHQSTLIAAAGFGLALILCLSTLDAFALYQLNDTPRRLLHQHQQYEHPPMIYS